MRHQRRIALGSMLAATALALTTMPALAADEATFSAAAEKAAEELPAGMLAAMERDLGLTTDEAKSRVMQEHDAAELNESLSEGLDGYAGSWLVEGTSDLVVATSDRAEAADIAKAGAKAQVVDHSMAELESV
ncbi:S1 family peptidase, partial [Streptomyces sp. ACA25]|nr:S1 family peptidase [Streptomyces sp. ACA25]